MSRSSAIRVTPAGPGDGGDFGPGTPGPDNFVVVTASVFDVACIVSSHPRGTSIRLDSTHGPIVNSRLFAEETNSQGMGLHLSDSGGDGHARRRRRPGGGRP